MASILTQRINVPMVLRVQGWLLFIEAAFMLLPMAVSFGYGESGSARAFLLTAVITAAAGLAMTLAFKPHYQTTMRKRDGLFLTAIIWVFFSAFGMLPYLFTGVITSVSGAFFETMAGFTTTGASVIDDVETLPHGMLFWRSLSQWLGGMGIILFTLAVLPMLNYKGGIALFNAEVTGITHERLRPRVSQTAKDLWLMYTLLTTVLALLLLQPMGGFDAVCHAMSTMATGGFSTKNDGLVYWNSNYVNVCVMVFMFLSGINFIMLFNALHGRAWRLLRSGTFRWYIGTTVGVSLLIMLYMWHMDFCDTMADRVVLAFFDTIAAITSTGFSSQHYETSGQFVVLLLMAVMLFGGMAGSTSGGAKIDRFVVLIKNTANEFYRVLHSNTVTTIRIDGKPVSQPLVFKTLAFLGIYLMVLFAVALVLAFLGLPIFDAIFTSLSTISNVGIGAGVTAPPGAFGHLPAAAQWLLALEMMVGRLEVFTVLIIFTKTFWAKN